MQYYLTKTLESPRAALLRAMALLAWVLLTSGVGAEPVELKVMTFNVRVSRGVPQEAAAENDWNDPKYPRRERAIRIIRQYAPDILGLQEARKLQVDDLRAALPEMESYGVGRDDGEAHGEFNPLFFRKDRFARVDAGSFWLSASPEKPGTTFSTLDRALPRMASWARLRETASGRELFVLNTHWDHLSAPARRKSAMLIRAQLPKLAAGAPAIAMGDLNTSEDSAPYRRLVDNATANRLYDSYRKVHPRRSPEESTFNHWSGTTAGSRIDFILHTAEFEPRAAEILRTSYDGRWPSDHYPVTATLAIEGR